MKKLFKIAEEDDIEVIYRNVPACQSISVPGHVCLDYGLLWRGAEERVHLAHELGHCETGSFYNRYSPFDVRQKHENRADKWAIKKLIPEDELNAAVTNGRTEVWELAEEFGVTEDFIRKAVCLYKNGHL